MTAEERVLAFAIAQIAEDYEAARTEYSERMDACDEKARESGQDIEKVVNSGMLWDDLMQNVADTRKYWVDRLERQGAKPETIRVIDPDYEPEGEFVSDGEYVAF